MRATHRHKHAFEVDSVEEEPHRVNGKCKCGGWTGTATSAEACRRLYMVHKSQHFTRVRIAARRDAAYRNWHPRGPFSS